jgi:uncharacterized membrane protein YuzA (DUF378 family)
MLGIALALAASLSWGVSDFFGGLKSRELSVLVVIGCSQLVGLVSIVLVALVVGKSAPSLHYVVLSMLSALCGTLGLIAFFRAMVVGEDQRGRPDRLDRGGAAGGRRDRAGRPAKPAPGGRNGDRAGRRRPGGA